LASLATDFARRALVATIALTTCLAPRVRAEASPVLPRRLTLEKAVALAFGNHPARLAEQARVGASRERIGEARSGLFPQVTGTAEYIRSTDNGIGNTVYLGATGVPRMPSTGERTNSLADTFNNYLGSLTAYQYLLDFGRHWGIVAQRSAEADAEKAHARLVDLDLTYAVSKAYYDLVAAREIVQVYEKAVAQRREHLHDAEVKAKAGLKPEIDVYTAKSELARAELNLADAQNGAATAKVRLDNTMGIGIGAPDYDLADTLTREPVADALDPFVDVAFATRPDLKMLEDDARAVGAEIKEYKSDYLPTIGGATGIDTRGQDTDPAGNGYVGLVIEWPLFNGFLTDHQVSEAKFRLDEIRHSIDDLRQQVYLQVKSAFLDWHAADTRIVKAEQTLAASRAELDLAQERYQTGLGSIIELIDAQRRYTTDRAASVQALADFSTAKAALARSVGGTWPAT
jgi:outer membrane protein